MIIIIRLKINNNIFKPKSYSIFYYKSIIYNMKLIKIKYLYRIKITSFMFLKIDIIILK